MVYTLDNRGLEPPEPLRRTLELLESLPAGAEVEMRGDRRPIFLLQELEAMGCRYTVTELGDEGVILRIQKP